MVYTAPGGRCRAPRFLIDADEKSLELSDLVTFARDVDRAGSNLFERKAILEQIQTRIAQHQVVQMYMGDRFCARCRSRRPIHDYRSRQIRALFGIVAIRAQIRVRTAGAFFPMPQ